jgi:hypothetical protein
MINMINDIYINSYTCSLGGSIPNMYMYMYIYTIIYID